MTRTVSLLLSRSDAHSQGSVAHVNRMVKSAFEDADWKVRSLSPMRPSMSQESVLPLALAGAYASDSELGSADLAFYDDAGLMMRAPDRRWARRTVVLYHGLAYGAGTWMANREIDLHCANSPYLARVLGSILAFPDWRTRRCLDVRAHGVVTDLVLPVPGISGSIHHSAFADGADLPESLLRLIGAGAVLGHAIQPGKQDMMATASILYWLNLMARERGTGPVRLAISAASLEPAVRQRIDAMFAPSGFRCDHFFIAVPHLKQSALHSLMRSCRFCLAYNRFPEPFGFYVLESVLNGCPVYTNGVGNNRHLLPAGHGIVVDETFDMTGDVVDVAAYRHVAQRILDDIGRSAETRQHSERGATLIHSRWSNETFARSIDNMLARLEHASSQTTEFDDHVVSLSPLVRLLDPSSGRCLNDYANTVLDEREVGVVAEVNGKACGDLDGSTMQRLEERHGLFRRGILALMPTPKGSIQTEGAG